MSQVNSRMQQALIYCCALQQQASGQNFCSGSRSILPTIIVLLTAYNSTTLAFRKQMVVNFPTRWELLRNVSKSYWRNNAIFGDTWSKCLPSNVTWSPSSSKGATKTPLYSFTHSKSRLAFYSLLCYHHYFWGETSKQQAKRDHKNHPFLRNNTADSSFSMGFPHP